MFLLALTVAIEHLLALGTSHLLVVLAMGATPAEAATFVFQGDGYVTTLHAVTYRKCTGKELGMRRCPGDEARVVLQSWILQHVEMDHLGVFKAL